MAIYEKIDEIYKKKLQTRRIKEDWLLLQTLLTGASRRKFTEDLPYPEEKNFKVLDMGTGFGALAIDIAAQNKVMVEAIDADASKIDLAEEIYTELRDEEHFLGKINFKQQNVEHMDYADNTFDLVVSRFVFQHLPNPIQAIMEIKRVLKKRGRICVVDMDDSLFIEYPQNDSYELLLKVKRDLQTKRGGDRYVGRKLAGYFHKARLKVRNVTVDSDPAFIEDSSTLLLQMYFFAKVFMHFREEIVENFLLTEEEFDYHFHQAYHHHEHLEFLNDARVIVTAVNQ